MKEKMSRNHTNAYVIRRLSTWLIMTVFIAFGAGCDEANTDKDNEQPFHTSGVASSSMNKAVNNDPILPAVQQQQPVQEAPVSSAFPVYTDKEFAALLEIPFDKVHRVELQADEQLDAVTELISDQRSYIPYLTTQLESRSYSSMIFKRIAFMRSSQ